MSQVPKLPTVAQKREAALQLLFRGHLPPDVGAVVYYVANDLNILEQMQFVDTLAFCPDVLVIGEPGTTIQFYLAFDLVLRQQLFQTLLENGPIHPNIKDMLEAEVIQQYVSPEMAIPALKRHRGPIYAQFYFQNDEYPDVYRNILIPNPYFRQLSQSAQFRSMEIFSSSNQKQEAKQEEQKAPSKAKAKAVAPLRSSVPPNKSNTYPTASSSRIPVEYYILAAQLKQALDDALLKQEVERARGIHDAIKLLENMMRQYSYHDRV